MAAQSSRKLAAILHADVVESTALVQLDESLAHERIRGAFVGLSRTTGAYGGTAHEVRGDALVAEFSRASDAVCAALTFQAENLACNTKIEDAILPRVRIGISLGEVVVADGTLTGGGVVVAQRLEQLAQPGGVVVQGTITETVPPRMPFDFADLGEQALKGFEQPVRAFEVSLKSGAAIPAPDSTDRLLEDTTESPLNRQSSGMLPSVVVLPFSYIGDDASAKDFAEALTDNMINTLSRTGQCRVNDQGTTSSYRGQSPSSVEVAEALDAEYVLRGGVRRSGERVRVTTELFSSSAEGRVWSDRFDGLLSDEFDLQDHIAKTTAQAVRVAIYGASGRAWQKTTKNFDAWLLNIQGVEQIGKGSKEHNHRARGLFEQVTALDPDYMWGPSNLAVTHLMDCCYGWADDLEHSLNQVMMFAHKARELDPEDPFPMVYVAHATALLGDYEQAVELADNVVRRGTDDPLVGVTVSPIYCLAGNLDVVRLLLLKSLNESPVHSFHWWLFEYLGFCHLLAGRYEEALKAYEKLKEFVVDPTFAHALKAVVHVELRQEEDARFEMGKAMALRPDFSLRHFRYYFAFRDVAVRERLGQDLVLAGLPE